MILWYPDTCPAGSCAVELERITGNPVRVHAACAHHAAVKALNGLSDEALAHAIGQTSLRKERAREAVRLEIGGPVPPFRVNSDGSVTVLTSAGVANIARVRARVVAALAAIGSPPLGVPSVDVE